MPSNAAAPRRFLVSFASLLALVVLLVVLAYQTFRGLASANRWSLHTYEVLTVTENVQQALAEMESGYRGYALTRDPRFREQWRAGTATLQQRRTHLRRLVADNPVQRRRLEGAESAVLEWISLQRQSRVLEEAVERDAAIEAASETPALNARSLAVSRARSLLREIENAESELLRERAARAATLEARARVLLLAGSLAAITLALITGTLTYRRTRRLAELNRELKAEVAERALARDALARISRQNALILESAAEGIYGMDPQGYTLFLNPAAARMLGRAPDDAIGRPFEAVLGMGAATGADAVNPVRATLSSGVGREVKDAAFRRADGTSFPVEYASTPIVEEGQLTGAVVTFRDVTERREVERMKDEFVSVVSHELRTPLTSIRGSLGLLAAGKLGEVPEKGRRMLEIAVQNTDRLVRLINDILDIERIESGRVTMELRPVDASELAHQSVEVMAAMAEKAGVRLYAWADRQPLEADPDRVLQVLTNLLSNAIKFSPPGGEVTLTTERGAGEAVFHVRDQGRGIPADRLESIFERFSQVDSSDARDKGGTGLGLAICRSIVQQHGGRIWVESEPGVGSTFTFTLPTPYTAPEPEVVAEEGEGPLVLVCDDDPSILAVVEEILRSWGYRTASVRDGEAAVREATRLRPDAILMDMMMPGMTGSDAIEALRRRPDTRSIPVVILSALKPMPRVQRAREVVDWVEKPFQEQGLLHALEEAVSVRWKPRRVLLVEDDPDLARVLLEVFGRHGIEALHAPTGVEAVEVSRRSPPDLLVLDLGLPHGDGYWVVEALRADDALRGVAMVVYTARELDEEHRERLRLGHTEFLTKGRVTPEEFEKRVVSLLNRIAPARHTTTGP
jgi:PAS domain S-box-containing protein